MVCIGKKEQGENPEQRKPQKKKENVACRLKAGILESERASIARQRLGNNVSYIIA
jgi:hypothetical protein